VIRSRARRQVLEILQPGNACTAWFQEADPDATEVFRSLHFEMEVGGTAYVYSVRDSARGQLFKYPWAARTTENGGRNSVIQLNGNGPFLIVLRALCNWTQGERSRGPLVTSC